MNHSMLTKAMDWLDWLLFLKWTMRSTFEVTTRPLSLKSFEKFWKVDLVNVGEKEGQAFFGVCAFFVFVVIFNVFFSYWGSGRLRFPPNIQEFNFLCRDEPTEKWEKDGKDEKKMKQQIELSSCILKQKEFEGIWFFLVVLYGQYFVSSSISFFKFKLSIVVVNFQCDIQSTIVNMKCQSGYGDPQK
jgi:hypothetical protein